MKRRIRVVILGVVSLVILAIVPVLRVRQHYEYCRRWEGVFEKHATLAQERFDDAVKSRDSFEKIEQMSADLLREADDLSPEVAAESRAQAQRDRAVADLKRREVEEMAAELRYLRSRAAALRGAAWRPWRSPP